MTPTPNFFIVGAAKAGTTSLASYLGQHPRVFMPDAYREPAFFASDTGFDELSDYHALFSDADDTHKAVGEKSTAYLFDEFAAAKIAAYCPNAKIIIVLRDQLDMAYSLYQHNRREGLETVSSFIDVVELEASRVTDTGFSEKVIGYHKNFFYITRATYAPQLKRFTDIFPEENIKILDFEDLSSDTLNVVRGLYEWLGVEADFAPNIRAENRGGSMRFQWIHDAYMRNKGLQSVARALTTRRLRQFVYRLNRCSSGYSSLSAKDREQLESLFADDRRELKDKYELVLKKKVE